MSGCDCGAEMVKDSTHADWCSRLEWQDTDAGPRPIYEGKNVVWAPQPRGQQLFLECPIFEALAEGNRGGGKTEALLMDFCQHVGAGYGSEHRGIVIRRTYVQLADFVIKTKKWIPAIWPYACFNEAKMQWAWPTGETLRLAYLDREEDFQGYLGAAFTWIGFEELTTWPDDKCYRLMMSCIRSAVRGIPLKIRATTNPYGPGHNWVKTRFALPIAFGQRIGRIVREEGEQARVAIHCPREENRILTTADPSYDSRIREAASNPAQRKAWEEGSWDVVAGGMFDGDWHPEYHMIPDVTAKQIPAEWLVSLSYDHGMTKPWSLGVWAESNGEPIEAEGRKIGTVKGDLIRIYELYGWTGVPNEGLRMLTVEIAARIRDKLKEWDLWRRIRWPGIADSSIFDNIYEPGKSVAGDHARMGVQWAPADKGPGSRIQGWQQMRNMLCGALPGPQGIRERRGLFACRRCEQYRRTLPVLPRDPKTPDDVDTNSEDHVADEVRYRIREKDRRIAFRDF